jgi:beta-lactamase superfamily II metal-dependent hydrolase
MKSLALLLCLAPAALLHAQSRHLNIYWIDVEGGGATLIVTPAGQSLLVDTGNPAPDDRDAKRIFTVASEQAKLKKIDFLLTTHYHDDHVGGAPALSKMIPIDRYFDHGDSVETKNPKGAKLYEAYQSIADGKRTTVKPGDHLPLKGLQVTVVSSNGDVITNPINGGGPNEALCKDAERKKDDRSENGRSAGILLAFNKFTFLDLGDLTWNKEMDLACPVNQLGTVTLFQATHHGFFNGFSGAPAHVYAIRPQVVIVNNGPHKGLMPPAYEEIAKIPDVQGIWQLHNALANDASHNTDEKKIANVEDTDQCKGNWLKVSVDSKGKFTVTNSRNGASESYTAR